MVQVIRRVREYEGTELRSVKKNVAELPTTKDRVVDALEVEGHVLIGPDLWCKVVRKSSERKLVYTTTLVA